jgi:hypothetical protein
MDVTTVSDVGPIIETSSSRLGLTLPPPKQKPVGSASAISNFLSKLPPPKSSPSIAEEDI